DAPALAGGVLGDGAGHRHRVRPGGDALWPRRRLARRARRCDRRGAGRGALGHRPAVQTEMTIRHAPYEDSADFAIGLRPIAEADWLEGGEADPAARKDPLFAARRETVFGELDGSRAGQDEVLELVDLAAGPV